MSVDAWYAVGDPTRRTVLARVAAGPCSVTEIARELPVSMPAVSQHLRVLREAGLVEVTPVGRQRIYRARVDGLERLRSELDAFWGDALSSFKRVAEDSYRQQEEQR